jgi:signal peptidase II
MMVARNRWLAAGVVGVVLADWVSKFLVTNHIGFQETRVVLEGWLLVTHRRNPGMSFSLLADLDAAYRTPLLSLLALVGIALTVAIIRSTPDPWLRGAAALVLAGAVGNLGDRLLSGDVTDFIYFTFFPYVFNLADAAITVGAVLMAARLLFERGGDDDEAPSPTFT